MRRQLCFVCGFHGESGGTQAIANCANSLSQKYQVSFVSKPFSVFNYRLDRSVIIQRELKFKHSIYITDMSIDIKSLREIKNKNKKIIVTVHGLKYDSHKLSQEHIIKVIEFADKIHFVSQVQQSSFKLEKNKYFIVPNASKVINKTVETNNIGSVGNLNLIKKRADQTIEIGLNSNADKIHLWFMNYRRHMDNRVVCHDFENDKKKIYNSFDVLVFMSEVETFGMVIIEAMSAGIPCVLPPLEVFQQFISCPGIIILDERDVALGVEAVNQLLLKKTKLRPLIKKYFYNNYSEKAITDRWQQILGKEFNLECLK